MLRRWIPRPVTRRIRNSWLVLWQPSRLAVVAVLALIGLYDTLQAQVFVKHDLPTLWDTLPGWEWSIWLAVILGAVLLVSLEGAHRKIVATEATRDTALLRIDRAAQVESDLMGLHSVRDAGVAIRNEGMGIQDVERADVWTQTAIEWSRLAESDVANFSGVEGGFMKTLDWFDVPNFKGVTQDQVYWLKMIHRQLEVLADIIKRHEPETRP